MAVATPTVAEAALEATPTGLRCKRHKLFRGYRRPSNHCARCEAIYAYARHAGIRETRGPRIKKQVTNQLQETN